MAETINRQPRFSRRLTTIFWSAVVALAIIALLIYERIDILYILATLALVTLLVVVATSNLEGKSKSMEN